MSSPLHAVPDGYVYVATEWLLSQGDVELLGTFSNLDAAMHACHIARTLNLGRKHQTWPDTDGWTVYARSRVSWYPGEHEQYHIELSRIRR